jgi:hypothetical protein
VDQRWVRRQAKSVRVFDRKLPQKMLRFEHDRAEDPTRLERPGTASFKRTTRDTSAAAGIF